MNSLVYQTFNFHSFTGSTRGGGYFIKLFENLTNLSEFHFVHAFTSVPMEESLSPEHSRELFTDSFEEFLDGCTVTNEGSRHLQTSRWDVTNSSLHIVWNPLDKVRTVLVLDVQHLFVYFFHGHATTENGGDGEVATMTRITGSHHVLGVKHLLGQLRNSQCTVLLGATAGEWGKARHEEMKTGERYHVNSQLSQICIQL